MANRLTPGLSTPSIRFFALRSDAPVAITQAEPGLSIGWRRSLDGQPLSSSFTTLTVSGLLVIDDPHSAGGLIVVDAATGEHRLDLPSTAAATGADAIDLQASATDTNLLFVVPPITIDAQVANAATQSKLLKYTQLLARKDAAIATDNAAELAEINADGGSGAGAFDNTSDAQEGIRDRGDAAWAGGGGVAGPGSRSLTWITQSSGSPDSGVEAWISTDASGSTVVGGTYLSDDSGVFRVPGGTGLPMLDDDVVYYGWRDSATIQFATNPIQFRYSTANSRWEIWDGAAYVAWT